MTKPKSSTTTAPRTIFAQPGQKEVRAQVDRAARLPDEPDPYDSKGTAQPWPNQPSVQQAYVSQLFHKGPELGAASPEVVQEAAFYKASGESLAFSSVTVGATSRPREASVRGRGPLPE